MFEVILGWGIIVVVILWVTVSIIISKRRGTYAVVSCRKDCDNNCKACGLSSQPAMEKSVEIKKDTDSKVTCH